MPKQFLGFANSKILAGINRQKRFSKDVVLLVFILFVSLRVKFVWQKTCMFRRAPVVFFDIIWHYLMLKTKKLLVFNFSLSKDAVINFLKDELFLKEMATLKCVKDILPFKSRYNLFKPFFLEKMEKTRLYLRFLKILFDLHSYSSLALISTE